MRESTEENTQETNTVVVSLELNLVYKAIQALAKNCNYIDSYDLIKDLSMAAMNAEKQSGNKIIIEE